MLHRLPLLALAILTALALTACAKPADQATDAAPAPDPVDAHSQMPDDDTHRGAMESAGDPHSSMSGMMGGALNREVVLDDAIRSAWRAIRVEVAELESDVAQQVEIPLGDTVALGDSGLTLEAVLFVPDFVMDEKGIASRSAEPANPAAKVVIREDGAEDYNGWLFAAMPGIHPFPHENYRVTLVAGVPAE
jgi:hypothetical protein